MPFRLGGIAAMSCSYQCLIISGAVNNRGRPLGVAQSPATRAPAVGESIRPGWRVQMKTGRGGPWP